jgi:hypothetical protein
MMICLALEKKLHVCRRKRCVFEPKRKAKMSFVSFPSIRRSSRRFLVRSSLPLRCRHHELISISWGNSFLRTLSSTHPTSSSSSPNPSTSTIKYQQLPVHVISPQNILKLMKLDSFSFTSTSKPIFMQTYFPQSLPLNPISQSAHSLILF